VRVVAEMECMGNFDALNAYDLALVSLGPCHWTMALDPSGGYDDAELPAFLAYFLSVNPDAYREALGRFGLHPADNWNGANAAPHWLASQLKYTGWLRFHNESTNPAQHPPPLIQMTLLDRNPAEADYLKTWHWFYRYTMAGRTIRGFQRAMWDMARIRIRDILGRNVSTVVANINISDAIGNIFTSEKAVAILMRWHVYWPRDVAGNRVLTAISDAVSNNSNINWGVPINQWSDVHESALTNSILTYANQRNPQHTYVYNWPNYPNRGNRGYALSNQLGNLRGERGSFVFDVFGI